MLSISSLYKDYGSQSQSHVFEDYSLELTDQRICIVAENGAGKSTLLLLIAGLLAPDMGTIAYDGTPVNELKRKHLCAIASDSIRIPGFLSARSVLELNHNIWQVPWPERLIEALHFSPHIEKQVQALSAGNLKKLHLINALMREPSILLLDEPNIALDENSVSTMWQLISNHKGMLIVASNEPSIYADKGFTIMPLHGA